MKLRGAAEGRGGAGLRGVPGAARDLPRLPQCSPDRDGVSTKPRNPRQFDTREGGEVCETATSYRGPAIVLQPLQAKRSPDSTRPLPSLKKYLQRTPVFMECVKHSYIHQLYKEFQAFLWKLYTE